MGPFSFECFTHLLLADPWNRAAPDHRECLHTRDAQETECLPAARPSRSATKEMCRSSKGSDCIFFLPPRELCQFRPIVAPAMGRTDGGNHARSYLSRRLDRCDSGDFVLLRSSLAPWRSRWKTSRRRREADIAPRFLQWSPIVLGALAATALSSVLLTFAVTIGLGVTSTAPTWRDASAALAILSGLYLIIQAVLSFGLGAISQGVSEPDQYGGRGKKPNRPTASTAWASGHWPSSWELRSPR